VKSEEFAAASYGNTRTAAANSSLFTFSLVFSYGQITYPQSSMKKGVFVFYED
jgi:hypothetical protein